MDALDVLSFDEATDILKVGASDTTKTQRLERAITAVSRRLDDLCGPIVARPVESEAHSGICYPDSFWVDLAPIYSDPDITLNSYDSTGTATAYSAEDFDTKPSYGYRLEPRGGLGGGYTGRIWARASSGFGRFGDAVVVSYTAGRYEDTDSVDPVFKEAGAVILENWWGQVLPGENRMPQGDFDIPGYRFPRFAVPDAALDIIPTAERMTVPVVA